ncbi:MAG TPA: PqqD family protein [Acidobacteriota bacterium]
MTACYSRNHDVVNRSIAGETILVPIKNHTGNLGSIYTLNEVGGLIWEMIDGHTPVQKIVESVIATYQVTDDEALRDVSVFLSALESAGLIRTSEG